MQIFHVVVVSILRYGCPTWSLIERMEKNLDGNHTRMVRVIPNNLWKQDPQKQFLYRYLPSLKRTTHADHSWRSKNELMIDILR